MDLNGFEWIWIFLGPMGPPLLFCNIFVTRNQCWPMGPSTQYPLAFLILLHFFSASTPMGTKKFKSIQIQSNPFKYIQIYSKPLKTMIWIDLNGFEWIWMDLHLLGTHGSILPWDNECTCIAFAVGYNPTTWSSPLHHDCCWSPVIFKVAVWSHSSPFTTSLKHF